MANPFVVSLKLVGDATSAVAATKAETDALEKLGRKLVEVGGKGTQQRIDAMMGIGRGQGGNRAADIAAYGASLDELKAKYDPLFAAEMRHKEQLGGIAAAQRVGALSAEEASAAVLREKAAYDQLTASLGRTAAASKQANVGNFNTANVAAQFQDIGVTAAMGMSPLQVALQQGTQLSAILGQTGAAGAAGMLKAALASILSPVSLLTIGLVGLSAVGIQSLSSLIPPIMTVDEALAEHAKFVERLEKAWPRVSAELAKYSRESRYMLQAAAREDLQLMQDTVTKANKALLDALGQSFTIQAGMPDLATPLEMMREELTGARGDVRGLELDLSNLPQQMDKAFVVHASFAPFRDEIEALRTALREGKPDIEGFQLAIETAVASGGNTPELRRLGDELIELTTEAYNAGNGLAEARAVMDRFGDPINLGQLTAMADAFRQLASIAPPQLDDRALALQARNLVMNNREASVSDRIKAENSYLAALERIAAREAEIAAERSDREAERAAKQVSAYDQAVISIRERIALAELENNVIGMSAFASEQLRIKLELETAARQDAIGLSPARIAEIDKEAAALARINATLHDNTALYNGGKELFTGFFADLGRAASDGEVKVEEFGDAVGNVLSKIRDKALGFVADGIWDSIFGSITGGGGGGGGGTGNILGMLFSAITGGGGGGGGGGSAPRGGFGPIGGGSAPLARSGSSAIELGPSLGMAASRLGSGGAGAAGGQVFHFHTTVDARGSELSETRLQEVMRERDEALADRFAADVRYFNSHPWRDR